MFARVKESRGGEYLQIVENYRDDGRVRQRVVMYVGHCGTIDEALERMPKERRALRRQGLREEADHLAEKLGALQRLVSEHPDVLNRDRERAERHAQRKQEAIAKRREARRGFS
jgi:hypothetical protein